MSQSRHVSADLDNRLAFETLISDLSARLVAATDESFEETIESALRQVTEFFGADRGGIVVVRPGQHWAHVLHAWYAHDFASPIARDFNLADAFPWAYHVLVERCGPHILDSTEDQPPEAERDRANHRAMGVRSTLNIPIVVDAAREYIISVESLRQEVHWPPSYVPRLQLLGAIFANTVERKRATDALREAEARLALAVRSAGAGAWDVELASGRIWATPEAKALYGFARDEDLTFDMILGVIHPDDVGRVRDRVTRVVASGSDSIDEYRVVLPGGGIRWITARGRGRTGPGGSTSHLMGMSLDVTALRLAEHERRTTAARLQAAVDVAALGFYLVTDRGEKADLDDRTRDLLGIPPGMETGIHAFWIAHVHPDDAARLGEISRQVLTMHVDRASAEYRYLHPTRGLAWYSHSIRAFELDKAGEVTTIAGVIQDITERKRGEEKLATAYADVQRLREQLERENIYLRQETTVLKGHASIVGRSPAIRHALMEIEQVAATDSTVLLLGETGTGKELFAAAIHNLSPRRDRLMVRVNCAAIPVTLIESELFGRERGAYTGALAKQIGRFEMANGSTIFLDEIGDLSMDIQVKLLRVLQERQIERLGNPKPVPVDLRIITATNRDLEHEVRKGRFREDLYYRLNVFPVRVPPLRDRLEDLALLVESLVGELAGRMGKRIESVSQASLERLRRHSWPGNVRELRNVIERAMILAQAPVLEIEVHGVSRQAEASASQPGTGGIDRERLLSVLHQTGWRIRGTNGAAERLCLKATTLEARMARLGIKRP